MKKGEKRQPLPAQQAPAPIESEVAEEPKKPKRRKSSKDE